MKTRDWKILATTNLLVLAMFGFTQSAGAQVNYAISGSTAYVTNSPYLTGDIVIASTYDGYPVTSIGDGAFADDNNLNTVTIPTSVTSIGNSAFYNSGLTSVTIPNNVSKVGVQAFSYTPLRNLTIDSRSIGDYAFQYCNLLTNLTVGAHVIDIGYAAFSADTGLTNLTLGANVASIGDAAFSADTGLRSVTIGGGSIGTNAFLDCTSLTNLTLGNSVNSICDSAFASCYGLLMRSVTIPSSVTNIGTGAFYECALTNAYFLGNAPSVDGVPGSASADTSVFSGDIGTAYYVPGTTGWSTNYGGLPTAGWYQPRPQILGSGYGLGVGSRGFQFTISWATNAAVVVDASTNLQDWIPISTNTLVNGTSTFLDSAWTNHPQRFYRVRPQ